MSISGLSPAENSPARGIIPARVIVVDDEPLIQWSVCTALAAAGFDAIGARTAEQARHVAEEWPPPRVVVLDIRPERERAELIANIRAIYPNCRFLVMSTDRRSTADHPYDAGVQTVEKPFDLAEIVRMIGLVVHGGAQ